jgi:hypothetical protein
VHAVPRQWRLSKVGESSVIPRQPQKVVVVNVAEAVVGVITVGHGHGHADDHDHVHDHHPSPRLGAWLDPGKACS